MLKAKPLFKSFFGLIILLVLLLVNHWVFSFWFKLEYLDWYMKNGALIGIVTAAVSMIWGNMREYTGLISANPLNYIGSYLQLVGLPIFVFGTHMRSNKGNAQGTSAFDILVTTIFVIALCVVLVIWLVTVVPLQYFVFLICGAPGRLFSNSQRQAVAKLNQTSLDIKEIGKKEEVPEGWWNVSISNKPVAITSLVSSLFFLIANTLLS